MLNGVLVKPFCLVLNRDAKLDLDIPDRPQIRNLKFVPLYPIFPRNE